ncbi:MAG: tRNA-2-methylthio-N6-dimethylallyladenosine synthase, partial [Roseivirga sp.]
MDNIIQDLDILDRNSQEATETILTSKEENTGKTKKLYIESYGCQMNFADSEIVSSIMKENGFDTTSE